MQIELNKYQKYMQLFYKNANDRELFQKLIEEVGELAAALNKKYNLKNGEFSLINLGEELIDIIYFAVAIGVANNIDLEKALLEKDEEGSKRYNRNTDLKTFLSNPK